MDDGFRCRLSAWNAGLPSSTASCGATSSFREPVSKRGRAVPSVDPRLSGRDWTLLTLRDWLLRMGYQPALSGIEFNARSSEVHLTSLRRRLRTPVTRTGRPASLIGSTTSGAVASLDLPIRAATAARLAVEAGAVRRSGGEVVIFQPTCANRAVMGLDMMDPHRRQAVTAQAQSSVGEWLGRPNPSRQLEDILASG